MSHKTFCRLITMLATVLATGILTAIHDLGVLDCLIIGGAVGVGFAAGRSYGRIENEETADAEVQ